MTEQGKDMLVLGIESATPVASVALADDQGLLGELLLNVGLTHSEQLLPMIDDLLRLCRRNSKEITGIGVSAGPGSFTGLRIGMATAKALAQGLSQVSERDAAPLPLHPPGSIRVRLAAIPTLEAMSWAMAGQPVQVSPMLNARREQVYTGLYRWRCVSSSVTDEGNGDGNGNAVRDNPSLTELFAARQRGKKERAPAGMTKDLRWTLDCLVPPEALRPEAWAERMKATGEEVFLLGDGVAMYKEIWMRDLGAQARLLPPITGLCRGSFIALAAMDAMGKSGRQDQWGEAVDRAFYGLKPIYLRGI
ncbi:MAG: tRNA (adenosine(37)-N6)-threonylcarbamoyltransferase complex dimerization subunit type 1 TsaB [Clostridiales bacterium]|nr:tRNA (adenosine(37)-N6)-threonylcarbamoyltransferase complex dimerization subunit type 1 TsaB [Clostridiales bacterium]